MRRVPLENVGKALRPSRPWVIVRAAGCPFKASNMALRKAARPMAASTQGSSPTTGDRRKQIASQASITILIFSGSTPSELANRRFASAMVNGASSVCA